MNIHTELFYDISHDVSDTVHYLRMALQTVQVKFDYVFQEEFLVDQEFCIWIDLWVSINDFELSIWVLGVEELDEVFLEEPKHTFDMRASEIGTEDFVYEFWVLNLQIF